MEELQPLIEKLQASVRKLDYTGTSTILDTIDDMLSDKLLPNKYSNQIRMIILPLFYPSDENSSKLRFSIQCISASKLVKWSPSTRIDILYSILAIFEKYPLSFNTKTCISQTAIDLLNSCKDVCGLIEEATKDFKGEVIWGFIVFAFHNSKALDSPSWHLFSTMIQNPATFYCSSTNDILSIMCRQAENWGLNPSFAAQFLDTAIKKTELKLGVSLPKFIFEDDAEPLTKTDKIIYIVASHIREANPQTARALASIVQLESKISDKLFQASLYLQLLKNAPQCYQGNLFNRLSGVVKTTKFEPSTAARIAAITSNIKQSKSFNLINYFSTIYAGDLNSTSMFFGHLADCVEILGENSLRGLLRDAFTLIASRGPSFGVCTFAYKILKRVQMNPHLVSPSELVEYRATILGRRDTQCIVPTAKVIGRISCILGEPIDIDCSSMLAMQLTTSGCAYAITAGSTAYPDDHILTAAIISQICDFKHTEEKIAVAMSKINANFPGDSIILSDSRANEVLVAAREALKWININTVDVFHPLTEAIEHMDTQGKYIPILTEFFVARHCDTIPPDVLPRIVKVLDKTNASYEVIRDLLISAAGRFHEKWKDYFIEAFNSQLFRAWCISRVFAHLAVKSGGPFNICESIDLNKIEFEQMLPALKKWLTFANVSEARAAAIAFVARHVYNNMEVTKYTQKLAFSIITRQTMPAFPDIPVGEEPVIDFNAPANENRMGPAAELAASLVFLSKIITSGIGTFDDVDLDAIHSALKISNDPRVRIPYLNFLSDLGLKGAAYVTQMEPSVVVTPFY